MPKIWFSLFISLTWAIMFSACADDETPREKDRSDYIGFVGGTEMEGNVPDDGSYYDGPFIEEFEIDETQIAKGSSLEGTLIFSDKQDDVEMFNVGVEGQDRFFIFDVRGVEGNAIRLELTPLVYTPGQYTLEISLTDAEGHDSAMRATEFEIIDTE